VRALAIALAGLGLLGGLVLALRQRRGTAAGAPSAAAVGAPEEDADALLRRIVALDEKFADRETATPPAEWAAYQSTRADLKARLARRVAPPSG
jgi:hypothetical protein